MRAEDTEHLIALAGGLAAAAVMARFGAACAARSFLPVESATRAVAPIEAAPPRAFAAFAGLRIARAGT